MQYLIQHNESQKLMQYSSDSILSLKDFICDKLQLLPSSNLLLQYYSNDWAEWLDIDDSLPPDRSKIRCFYKKEIISEKNEPQKCSSQESALKELPTTTCVEMTVKQVLKSPTLKKPWPKQFNIPVEKFTTKLSKALDEQKCLSWNEKHELMEILADEIQLYTLYPSRDQRKDVANALVKKYPFLREKIGSGTSGLESYLDDKMKNVRVYGNKQQKHKKLRLKVSYHDINKYKY